MKPLTKLENEIKSKKIYYLSKTFHYSTDLPVRIIKNDSIILSLPEEIVSAYSILKLDTQYPKYSKNDSKIQIVDTEYHELYVVLNVTDQGYTVIVGPAIRNKIESGLLTNMLRNSVIPFHKKTNMKEHYDLCKLLNEEKLYYTCKYIEHIFKEIKEIEIPRENEIINQENTDSYFKQKSEYRYNDFIHSPYFIEQEISNTISNGDIEKTKRVLKEINLTPHAKLASNTLRSYKNSMICSCAFMTRAAIQGGVNPNDAFTLSDAYINNIENLLSIQELESFEQKMAEGFAKKVKEIKANVYSPAILNTIYYIDNHLCEDIQIDSIAKEVYLNPSYLSSLFHKETGKTISEWIKTKRIEEAAHFVLNSNDDIADIALFYNFCSQSYFVQCFKKIMGVTPGEYRKNGKKNKR